MHAEWGRIDAATAARLNAVRAAGGRLIAVGTTSLRLLESAAGEDGAIRPFEGDTAIFITPGYRFRAIDGLMTNFHLPRSTLFMLVSALMGLDVMKAAYAHAIAAGYRFYSYGDASLLLPEAHARDAASPSRSPRPTAPRAPASSQMPRGEIRTPAFMPVGTAATVKAMRPEEVRATRRRHHPRQHLSSDAAARRRAGGAARRAAQIHGLGAADPDRQRRLPGDEPVAS